MSSSGPVAGPERRGEEEIGKLVKIANTDESNFVKSVNSFKESEKSVKRPSSYSGPRE